MLIRFLVLAAILLAGIGMSESHAQVLATDRPEAVQGDPAPGHCHDSPAPADPEETSLAIDCMIACSLIPASAGSFRAPPAIPAEMPAVPAAIGHEGLHPQSDPPPPRFS